MSLLKRIFSRKAAADTNTQDYSSKSSYRAAKDFIQAASAFEKSEIEMTRKNAKFAYRVATLAAIAAVLAIIAVVGLTPLKSVEPFVVRVDNNTGYTDVVSTLKHKTAANDEVLDKYWLAQYVRYREGYDWETIQSTYDATNLLSAPAVQQQFSAIYNSAAAPHKVLTNQFRVTVKIRNISFVGDTAQVRFDKQVVPTNPNSGTAPKPAERWIATLAYAYENKSQSEADRLVNPLGFQVTSYRADPEQLQ